MLHVSSEVKLSLEERLVLAAIGLFLLFGFGVKKGWRGKTSKPEGLQINKKKHRF